MVDYSKIPFSALVDECMDRDIKVTEKDTEETLRKKLAPKSSKPAKSAKPKK